MRAGEGRQKAKGESKFKGFCCSLKAFWRLLSKACSRVGMSVVTDWAYCTTNLE